MLDLSLAINIGTRIGGFSPASLFAASEPGGWYDPSDLSTLFQDSAGTTPVTAPGQTVGMVLDRSKGLVLGPELVTNGGFSSATGWTLDAGASIGSGLLTFASVSSTFGANQTLASSFSNGQFAQVTLKVDSITAGQFRVRLNGGTYYLVPTSPGTYTFYVQAGSGSNQLQIHAAGTTSGTIDNISVRELPGNHLTQSTLSNRAIYGVEPVGGRRNLLTYTEQFDNAAWSKLNATITTNNAAAPDGTMTADLVVSTGGETRVGVNPGVVVANTTYTASVFGKFSNANGRYLWFRDFYAGRSVGFDLQTGVVTQADAGITGVVSVSTDGYFRCVATWTTPASPVVANQQFWVQSASGTSAAGGTSGGQCLIWGAQLEVGSTATAYQRVVTAFDVTEAGVPSLSYIQFDGSDDWLVSPTITPGIDKAQVFAGVRMLSGTPNQLVYGYSADPTSVAGSFGLRVNTSTTAQILLVGSTLSNTEPPVPNVPSTSVLAHLMDIGAALGAENGLKVNGNTATYASNAAGTGNFSNQALYVGRFGGVSNPYNGRIYSLIVRFGANLSASTITQTENWVAGKTGIYTLEQLSRLNAQTADGTLYSAYAASDAQSNNYLVNNTVLAADGTSYNVI